MQSVHRAPVRSRRVHGDGRGLDVEILARVLLRNGDREGATVRPSVPFTQIPGCAYAALWLSSFCSVGPAQQQQQQQQQ